MGLLLMISMQMVFIIHLIDIPGIPGASQTIWFVANDLNAARTKFMYGTQPMGVEYQATYWE